MLLSRQAALQSYRRANTNTVSLRHSRATRGTSARRGATTRLPLAEGGTIGGSPPKPPQQEKGAAEGDGDENKTQGWYQAAVQAAGWAQPFLLPVGVFLGGTAAFFAAVGAILGWHSNIATRADIKETEGRMSKSIQDVQDSVHGLKESVDGMKGTVDGMKGTVDGLKGTVDGLKGTMGILQVCGWGQFIALVIAGAFAAGRGSK